jgi:hypothetical protein
LAGAAAFLAGAAFFAVAMVFSLIKLQRALDRKHRRASDSAHWVRVDASHHGTPCVEWGHKSRPPPEWGNQRGLQKRAAC